MVFLYEVIFAAKKPMKGKAKVQLTLIGPCALEYAKSLEKEDVCVEAGGT